MEQSPLVMGVVTDAAQVARVLREGADIVDLRRASGTFVHEVRHTHTGVPIAVDVAGGARDLAGIGADLLYDSAGSTERELTALAAESGAAVVCSVGEAERLRTEGMVRVFVTPGWRQDPTTLRRGRELAADWSVLLTVSGSPEPGGGGESDAREPGDSAIAPDTIAAAALAAMAGVRIVRTTRVTETRRTVDMIASIAGTRQPARVRRALA
ncbi:hypothetical protein [Haloechinothrix halophila]|uniref:hypothetical protein n=1 Tax=Haloechinothrix halophila TaxID=1069073 RepID=UPI0012F78710|nr:hypothetical protein [Haloechinothrix halophila]